MLPMTTRGKLHGGDLAQVTNQGDRERQDLGARPRVDSGIDLHDARPWLPCSSHGSTCGLSSSRLGFDGDEEPTQADIERQRAYADWLARFEPRQNGTRQGEGSRRLVADQIHARPGERAA